MLFWCCQPDLHAPKPSNLGYCHTCTVFLLDSITCDIGSGFH